MKRIAFRTIGACIYRARAELKSLGREQREKGLKFNPSDKSIKKHAPSVADDVLSVARAARAMCAGHCARLEKKPAIHFSYPAFPVFRYTHSRLHAYVRSEARNALFSLLFVFVLFFLGRVIHART